MASTDKLKILCIHGYRQDGETFNKRTGAFRKLIKKYADLVFIDAPNMVPPLENAEEPTDPESQRGWWFSRQDDDFKAQEPSACAKGYDLSLDVIRAAFREQGPFDGVLGFSQGASMVSLLCALRQQNLEPDINFRFAILVAGFRSRSEPHAVLYKDVIQMPTLHVYGETDGVIEKGMSIELLQYFHDPVILEHSSGHFIPASAPQKTVYIQFLEEMQTKKESQNS